MPTAKVLPTLRRGNVVGALTLGLAPSDADHDAMATLTAAAEGRIIQYVRSEFRRSPTEYWAEQWRVLTAAFFRRPGD